MTLWIYPVLIVLGFRLILYLNRKGYFDRKPRPEEALPGSGDIPDRPVAFGNKSMWLAVPTTDPQRLAQELGLKDIKTCNWQEGISRSIDDETFITPPVDGWCMVLGGLPYPDMEMEMPKLKALLERLSGIYGRAFYFGSYISVGMECWMRAEEGRMIRSFLYMEGEILEDEGQRLEGEVGVDARCPAEEVAANWCINPATLETRTDLGRGLGLIGELPFEKDQ